VGSNDPVPIDVRLVAATNKSLQSLVQQGSFREDLFFRLNVLKIDMPPLRDRPADILILANSFLSEFSEENHRTLKPFDDETSAILQNYGWPGNVRELRTAVEHGVVLSNSDFIEPKHLPAFMKQPLRRNEDLQTPPSLDSPTSPKEELNLQALERDAISRALKVTDGNKTRAATLLGISRRTLQRKLSDDE